VSFTALGCVVSLASTSHEDPGVSITQMMDCGRFSAPTAYDSVIRYPAFGSYCADASGLFAGRRKIHLYERQGSAEALSAFATKAGREGGFRIRLPSLQIAFLCSSDLA